MKSLLTFLLLLFTVSIYAANPTFQSFDTNAFIPNASANTIQANTSASNPSALVKQSQITAGGISLSQATNAINGSSGVIGTNGNNTTFKFSPTGTNDIQSLATNVANAIATNNYVQTNGSMNNATITNGTVLLDVTASTDLEANSSKKVVSLANGTGVKTNNNAGGVGWSSAFTGTWIAAGTLPKTATDTSWMPLTNAVAFSNATGLPTSGKALVIAPGGTNSYGAVLLNETNWPTGGGGSQTPWTDNEDATGFSLTNLGTLTFSNSSSGTITKTKIVQTFSAPYVNLTLTSTTNNGTASSAGIILDGLTINQSIVGLGVGGVTTYAFGATNGSIIASNATFNGGPVSIIPTNAALFGSVIITIPIGTKLTNTWNARADVEIVPVYNDVIGGSPRLNYKRGTSTTNWNVTFNPFDGISANASFTNQPLVITDFGTNEWILLSDVSTTTATVGVVTNGVHLK